MPTSLHEAFLFRHACKLFDHTRTLSDEIVNTIFEAGRLSPSSFGMEHWRFIDIQTPSLREELKALCWNQAQITTASKVIVISAQKAILKPYSDYVKKRFETRGLSPELTNAYLNKYAHFMIDKEEERALFDWSAKQCYIAAANMMTAAAVMKVDSCPIEGFEGDKVNKLLGLDTTQEQTALIICFGYRVNEPQQKNRLSLHELIRVL